MTKAKEKKVILTLSDKEVQARIDAYIKLHQPMNSNGTTPVDADTSIKMLLDDLNGVLPNKTIKTMKELVTVTVLEIGTVRGGISLRELNLDLIPPQVEEIYVDGFYIKRVNGGSQLTKLRVLTYSHGLGSLTITMQAKWKSLERLSIDNKSTVVFPDNWSNGTLNDITLTLSEPPKGNLLKALNGIKEVCLSGDVFDPLDNSTLTLSAATSVALSPWEWTTGFIELPSIETLAIATDEVVQSEMLICNSKTLVGLSIRAGGIAGSLEVFENLEVLTLISGVESSTLNLSLNSYPELKHVELVNVYPGLSTIDLPKCTSLDITQARRALKLKLGKIASLKLKGVTVDSITTSNKALKTLRLIGVVGDTLDVSKSTNLKEATIVGEFTTIDLPPVCDKLDALTIRIAGTYSLTTLAGAITLKDSNSVVKIKSDDLMIITNPDSKVNGKPVPKW